MMVNRKFVMKEETKNTYLLKASPSIRNHCVWMLTNYNESSLKVKLSEDFDF